MKTYSIQSENQPGLPFEIQNSYIRPRTIAALLEDVEGVTGIRLRRSFSASSEIHVRFRYKDQECVVWEPYGDSSRYWVGPENEEASIDLREVEAAFTQYEPPLPARILGDLLSLNFKSLFGMTR